MPDILFYDGKCSLCAREISTLRRFKDQHLQLVDIHSQENHQSEFENQDLLSVLHLKTGNGEWVKGLDATVKAWRHTPFGWLLAPLRWPLIRNIADWAYYRWANKRACRLGYQ